ncbi:MAG: hypothetical protein LC772_11625, partial [Chloroflexi bacterium]|nr:hypothetical protein [Chloroflexota bacterium]
MPGTDFLIDSHGISGSISVDAGVLPTLSLDNFAATLNKATFVFTRGALTTGSINASVAIPAWDNQKVAINASISPSGLLTIGLDLQNPLTVTSLGMQVALSAGSIQIADDGTTRLMLTGAFAFPGIPQFGDAALQFTNLGIGSDGHIYLPNSNWITLPHPATIDLSLLSLDCTQIGFGQDSNGLWVGLTGGVKLSADLPVSGDVQFSGLTIHAGANGAGPSLSIGTVHLVAEVQNIATVEAYLGESNQNGIDCLYG